MNDINVNFLIPKILLKSLGSGLILVFIREASCTGKYCCGDQNPNDITGALAGGPGAPDDYYNDDRGDNTMNEVTLDYNAGFQMAIAGLNSI